MEGGPQPRSRWFLDPEKLELDNSVRLGIGNSGDVWRGVYLGTEVAVKIPHDIDTSERTLAREIEALMKLNHPNIVILMGFAVLDDNLHIVTELVPGGALHSKLNDLRYQINWKKRVSMLRDAALAMSHLHSCGKLHRNLNSYHLLLTEDWVVKLTGFGRTREMPKTQEDAASMTSCTGGLPWMAPEVALGKPYDCQADVFSFGMLMCEVIFRVDPPLRGRDKEYVFHPEQYAGNLPKDIPADLWALLCECANTEPEERPAFLAIIPRLQKIVDSIEGAPEWSYDDKMSLEELRQREGERDKQIKGPLETAKPDERLARVRALLKERERKEQEQEEQYRREKDVEGKQDKVEERREREVEKAKQAQLREEEERMKQAEREAIEAARAQMRQNVKKERKEIEKQKTENTQPMPNGHAADDSKHSPGEKDTGAKPKKSRPPPISLATKSGLNQTSCRIM